MTWIIKYDQPSVYVNIRLMKSLWNKNILPLWNKLISVIDTPIWLEIFFIILIILRIPSFFEPYYYGDEMIYLTLGEGIRHGVPLYLGVHDNKPPLIYLVAAISGNLFIFKAILAFWNILTVYGFWKLVKHLFPKNITLQNVSTVIFGLLTTLPLFEGNIANAELFMICPVIFAFWILLSKTNNFKNVFISGILFSIGALFKIPAAFDILGIIVFWLIYTKLNLVDIKEFFKKSLILSAGFLIPIVFTFIWFYFSGSFKEYVVAAFLQNFGYVSSWRPAAVEVSFLQKNGPLLIRAGIMFFGFFILWLSRRKLSKEFVLVSGWLLATLFAVTLSERPYPHYFVQSLAPISILIGMLISLKNFEQTVVVLPLSLAFFIPFYFKFWYYPTVSYYERFINFATKRITKDEYFNSFSPYLTENYKIADFLVNSSKSDEKIFVWSNDSSAIYSLSRRLPPTKYVADYHIKDFSSPNEVVGLLKRTLPKFLIITKNSSSFPELVTFAEENYYIISENETTQIWINIKK